MKKLISGIIACLGVIASILAIADVLPEYNNIFLVLIGVFVGYLLGALAPKKEESGTMSDKTKGFMLMVVMFLLPPILLISVIASISALGFLTNELISNILGWGVVFLLLAYIVAGVVTTSLYGKASLEEEDEQSEKCETKSDAN